MKILRAMKRTMAYVLTAAMLLTGVDSLSLTSYAGEYAGSDTSANEIIDLTGNPAVSTNEDTEPTIVEPSGNEPAPGESSDDEISNSDSDVSDNLSVGDISHDNADDADVSNDEPASFDVSENDISENDLLLKSGLRSSGGLPKIMVAAGVLQEGGYFVTEDISGCNSLEEAQEVTREFYNSTIKNNEAYSSPTDYSQKITWVIYDDLELTGEDPFLDEEGIAPWLNIELTPHQVGDDKFYPDIYVPAGVTVETCALFEENYSTIDAENGLYFWGEKDQSDGCRIILGSGSTLCLYTSDLVQYNDTNRIWAIVDPTGNATLKLGKEGHKGSNLISLHIGSETYKLGNLILEGNKDGCGYLDSYYDEYQKYGIWSYIDPSGTEAVAAYAENNPVVIDIYVKNATVKGEKIWEESCLYPGEIDVWGTAVIDSLDLAGSLYSKANSNLTVGTLKADAESASIELRGNVVIKDKIDIYGRDTDGTNGYDSYFDIRWFNNSTGSIYLPETITNNTYHWTNAAGDVSTDYATKLRFTPVAPKFDDEGRETGWAYTNYELGVPLFYAEPPRLDTAPFRMSHDSIRKYS